MALTYSWSFTGVAQTAQQDEFEIQPGDDKPVTPTLCAITQETEFGDAQEEQILFTIVRGNTTSGSGGGSSPTGRPTDRNNTVTAGATVEINNTTKGTSGTTHTLHPENWAVRTGWYYIPIPEIRHSVSQADTTEALPRMGSTPADSITADGVLYFDEN